MSAFLPPSSNGGCGGGAAHMRREPLLHEDYYTTDYEPTDLLNEWRSLQQQCLALEQRQQQPQLGSGQRLGSHIPQQPQQPQQHQVPRRSSRGQSRSSVTPSSRPGSQSRKVRSSLALDLHYARQKQESITAFDGLHSSVSSSSSSSSADSAGNNGERSSSSSAAAAKARATYSYASDPYDRSREIARQEKFISENKRLGQPFVPSANREGAPTRLLLGDCVRDLYKCVIRDWPEADPMVVSTAEDLIVIYFSLHTMKKREAATVLTYMNSFAMRNEAVREFRLSKVREGWDVLTDDGHLMYTLRPPWVKKGKRFLPDTIKPTTAHVPQ